MSRCSSCRHQRLLSYSNPEPAGYKPSDPTTKSRLFLLSLLFPITATVAIVTEFQTGVWPIKGQGHSFQIGYNDKDSTCGQDSKIYSLNFTTFNLVNQFLWTEIKFNFFMGVVYLIFNQQHFLNFELNRNPAIAKKDFWLYFAKQMDQLKTEIILTVANIKIQFQVSSFRNCSFKYEMITF